MSPKYWRENSQETRSFFFPLYFKYSVKFVPPVPSIFIKCLMFFDLGSNLYEICMFSQYYAIVFPASLCDSRFVSIILWWTASMRWRIAISTIRHPLYSLYDCSHLSSNKWVLEQLLLYWVKNQFWKMYIIYSVFYLK